MRNLIFVLGLLVSSPALALEPMRTQCNEEGGFGLRFGERVSERDLGEALRAYPDFSMLLINDGDISRPLYRVTAVARYRTPEEAELRSQFIVASLLNSPQYAAHFAGGYVDYETLDGIILYSGDPELNEGVAMEITHEHASAIVRCTDLQARSEAFTAP